MKKIFTLFVALLALTFCAKAQILDGFESYTAFTVDPAGTWTYFDGDSLPTYGINGISFTNSNYTGSCIVFNPTLTSPDCSANYPAHSGSQYLVFFNGIPDEEAGVSATNDWIISPALSFTESFTLNLYAREIVTNYGAEVMKIWYSTTTNNPSAFTLLATENVSATTWTQYNYTIPQAATYVAISCNSEDVFGLMIDDISIMVPPTTPTIVANDASIDLGTVIVGNSNDGVVNITTYNLNSPVTATTNAPFTVSADSLQFGTTASIPATGGPLYVRYTPTDAGTINGTVILSATGAENDTVTLTGTALDCSNITLPYAPDLASTLGCWTNRSDSTESGWFPVSEIEGIDYGQIISFSAQTYLFWLMDIPHDNWLTSPVITMPETGNYEIAYKVAPFAPSYPSDHYGVYVISGDQTTLLFEETISDTNFVQRTVLIPSTVTGDFQVAFRHFNSTGGYVIIIDSIQIRALSSAPVVTLLGPAEAEEGTAVTYTAQCGNAESFAWSVNGTPLVGNTTNTLTQTFTDAGNYTVSVVAVNPLGTATDSITTEVYHCDAITAVPYTQDFENGIRCWNMYSADPANDEEFGLYEDEDAFAGDYDFMFSSYSTASDYNQYLISKELDLPNTPHSLVFQYRAESANESFRVLASTTTNDIDAFTNVLGEVLETEEDEWTGVQFLIPAGTKYVAINYFGEYVYRLNIDNIVFDDFNTPPTVTLAGPASVQTNVPATFIATSYTAETFAWEVDNVPVNEASNVLTHTFTTPGSHTVKVTATNFVGSANASMTVNVFSCDDAATLPFFEGFENELSECWANIDADGDGLTWASTLGAQIATYEGDGAYSSESYSNDSEEALTPDNWLITPVLAIPAEGATLSFYVSAQDASWAKEHYGVYVSTSGIAPSDFTLLFEETIDSLGGSRVPGAWKQKVANLPYGGQNIRIAIRHFNVTDMYRINIDNLKVDAGLVGIEDHEVSTKVFPNPAKNVLNINATSNINRIEVYNMMGQVMGVYNVNDMNTQINTSNFANGVYTVKIETENGTSTKKFTVAR